MNQLQIVNNEMSEEKIALLKRTICKGASDDELQLFVGVCARTGLDAFARQIYAVKRWNSKERREEMAIQISVDGFRVVAARSQDYAGQLGPFWCGSDAVWKDVWLDKDPPKAAKVGVMRKGFGEPIWAVARFEAYAQTTKEGQLTNFWRKMPDLMIAKVAECLALRRAFPQDLSGLYSAEETGDEATDSEITQAKTENRTTALLDKIKPQEAAPEPEPVFVEKKKPGPKPKPQKENPAPEVVEAEVVEDPAAFFESPTQPQESEPAISGQDKARKALEAVTNMNELKNAWNLFSDMMKDGSIDLKSLAVADAKKFLADMTALKDKKKKEFEEVLKVGKL